MKLFPLLKKPRTLTHFQQLQQKHNHMMPATKWPHFSPCNSTDPIFFSPPDSVFKDYKSPLSSTRTFTSSDATTESGTDSSGSCPAWKMNSLMDAMPLSPSPICSPCTSAPFSPSSDAFSSRISTEFSALRDKSFNTGPDTSKQAGSIIEINKWMDEADDFFRPNLRDNSRGMEKERSSRRRLIPICEETRIVELGYDGWRPSSGADRLLSRPKPYRAFLDEIKKRETEAQVNASRKATQTKFMSKLKGKEAAIRQWESRKTKIAMIEMKKMEDKLEKRRAKAYEEMQKKISKAQKNARMMKVKERKSIFKKISRAIEAAEIEATRKGSKCLKLTMLC